MATTREKIDSRGKSLLQLLIDKEDAMSNLMNPSSRDQNTYEGPDPAKPVDILWPMAASPTPSWSLAGQSSSLRARQGAMQGKARHCKALQGNARHCKAMQGNAEGKAKGNALNLLEEPRAEAG